MWFTACKPLQVYMCKLVVYHTGKDCPYIPDCWNCTRQITHVNVVELTEHLPKHLPLRFTHVNQQFTHVNWWFTHRQTLSLHV